MSSAKLVRAFKLVVVSPSDVRHERESVTRVADEFNRTTGRKIGLQLQVFHWEPDTYPAFHLLGPQGAIDERMNLHDADLVVGVFWMRFGSPVYDAESGTEHELRNAWELWRERGTPQIMIYFSQQPATPTSTAQIDQWARVLRFREELPAEAFPRDYTSADEFESQFRVHLNNFLLDRHDKDQPSAPTADLFGAPSFPDLIERPGELQRLRETLAFHPLVSVEGLSGSGKTYLVSAMAAEVARSGAPYRRALWYQPEPGERLDQTLDELQKALPLVGGSAHVRCRSLLTLLKEQNALLIVDDYHTLDTTGCVPLLEQAGRAGAPCRLVLLSTSYADHDLRVNAAHFHLSGLAGTEVEALLRSRRLPPLDRGVLAELIRKTGGLPLATSFFATLVGTFGYTPEELLAGSMLGHDRLRQWFEQIVARLKPPETELLRGLSACDGAFDRGVVRALAALIDSGNVDASFDALLRAFMVQRYTLGSWRVHPLIAQLALAQLTDARRQRVHLHLAEHFLGRMERSWKGVLVDAKLPLVINSMRHLQAAGAFDRAERLLQMAAPSLKARGHFEVLFELCRAQLENEPGANDWTRYNYAHACQVTGRLALALEVTEQLHVACADNQRNLGLSSDRLYAAVLNELGYPDRGLKVLSPRIARTRPENPPSVAWTQALAAQAGLMIETGDLDGAEEICNRMIADLKARPDPVAQGVAFTHLGRIQRARGKSDNAERLFGNASRLFRDARHQRAEAWALIKLALSHLDRRRTSSALRDAVQMRAEILECSREYLEDLHWCSERVTDAATLEVIEREYDRVHRVRAFELAGLAPTLEERFGRPPAAR